MKPAVLALMIAAAVGVAWLSRDGDGIAVVPGAVARTDRLQSIVTASGEIVASRYADIGSTMMGRLVSLGVKEGDRVSAGQILARIDPIQASSMADAAGAALSALEADAQASRTQVAAAAADLDDANARQVETQKALQRAQQLSDAGLLPAADLDRAQAAAAAARAQVASAAAALDKARQTSVATDRRVTQGQAERVRARDQLAKTEITAPIDGVVTRMAVQVGEMVVVGVQNQPGTILMTISDLGELNAEVKVAEADVMRLSSGMAATVALEALPEARIPARVVEIGASALPLIGGQAAAREFKVKVRLDRSDLVLRPGLTCDVEIVAAERRDVLTVPLAAVIERNGQAGVFRIDGEFVRFTPVKTGIIGGLSIEVSGIDAGAPIVTGPIQSLRDLQDGARVSTTATR